MERQLALRAAPQGLIPAKEMPALARQIQAELLRETGFSRFENFRVDWSPASLKCVKTATEMDHEVPVGACVVSASAMQMEAKLVIARKIDGFELMLLYWNVE